jgi:hypothetical protein
VTASRAWPVGLVILVCAAAVLWAGFGPDGWLPGVPTILSWARGSVFALQ